MFPPWRFQLREAQVAFEQGRLDEAAQLVGQPQYKQYLPVQQLLAQVAEQLARRSLERSASGDFALAWRDLDTARQLAGETNDWQQLALAVAEVAAGDVVNHLKASDYAGASARLDALDRRNIPGFSGQTLREVARRLQSAHKLSQRGKFVEAEDQLAAAAALYSELPLIAEKRQAYRQRAERAKTLSEQLHAVLAATDWPKVLAVSSELLELSPDHRVARDARQRAWAEVGEEVGDSRPLHETQHWAGMSTDRSAARGGPGDPPAAPARRAPRFMLWIDAVGGYLVCLGEEIIIGQAVPGGASDVPIQADISRRHAKIVRHKEGYVLEPLSGRTAIRGKPVTEPKLLADGDELLLGEAVQLRFRKPHVLSSSARLEMTSVHRTQPFADAVVLMAESCVLGPKSQNHVVCRDWASDVVLYRSDDKLMCRSLDALEINGNLVSGRGELRPGCHVVGSDFSLSVESV
jgi:hypothetical protein